MGDERDDLWDQRRVEQSRLATYQRQRARVWATPCASIEWCQQQAEDLDYSIALTQALIDEASERICDLTVAALT